MITLYSKDFETEYGVITSLCEAFVEEERNGLFELRFVMLNTDSLFNYVKEENIVVANANDTLLNQKFRIYMTRKLMNNRVEVYARHISFDLMYDYIDNVSFENQSCEYALNQLFRNSNFSTHYRGYSDIVNAQNYNMSMANVLEAIGGKKGSIIDTFGTGAEILRDNENIHVLNKRGHDNGVTIEYRKNLTGFELEEDTTDLVTRILPYAKYNDSETNEEIIVKADYVDSPLIANYSHPYIKSIDYSDKFEDGEIPTVSKLQDFARKEYRDNKVDIPKQNYKIEFMPLSKCVGYEGLEDKISLCDTVTVIDTRYNVKTQAKVIKTVFNVLKNRYESMELGEPKTSLGDIVGNNDSLKGEKGDKGDKGDKGEDGNIGDFPNSLPLTPIVTATVYGFANIEISWTFENKVYYQYEVYASKEVDFIPNTFNLIHQGQTSSFMYQAKPNETWYFKVCAINTHGERTSFGSAYAITSKVSDLSNYVSEMAISDALIGTMSLDRGWIGKLNANLLDVKGNFSVTDGNGKRTIDIDSFGNVNINATSLSIKNKSIYTSDDVDNKIQNTVNITEEKFEDLNNYIENSYKDGIITEQEKKVMLSKLDSLKVEYNQINSQVEVLMSTKELYDTQELTDLSNAKQEYTKIFELLSNKIQELNYIAVKKELKIHFIKSRTTGDCILLQYDGKNILIDSNEEASKEEILLYLKSLNVSNLDYIICTHHHSDHNGAFPYLINSLSTKGCKAYHRTPNWSLMPSVETGWKTREYHDKFVNACKSKSIPLVEPREGERITLSSDLYLEFYNTSNADYNNYNNLSLVNLVVYKNKKILLSGDIGKEAQAKLINSMQQVDVYKASHHDYDGACTDAFMDKLNFKDCILTNILKHEDNRPRAVIGYCQYHSKPYYAQFDNGTIVLTCDGDSYNINAKASLYKNAWWNRNYTGNWYWFKSDGKYAKNESIKIGEKTYNFDSTGLCTNS